MDDAVGNSHMTAVSNAAVLSEKDPKIMMHDGKG